jgi:hypothetical protein
LTWLVQCPWNSADISAAVVLRSIVDSNVAIELFVLAVLRERLFHTSFVVSLANVTVGGALIVAISVALGSASGLRRPRLQRHHIATRLRASG